MATAAFSLYAARPSGLHRLHPLTKLNLTGLFLVGALALPGVWSTYLAFLLVLMPLAAWGQVTGVFLGRVVRVVAPFAVSLLLIQGFLWPGGTPVVALGPLSLKQEGLVFAALSTGRILMIVGSFLLFSLSTPPDALMTGLAERGLPATLSYIVLATLQIVPRFQARAAAILDAQQARGLEIQGSFLRRLRALLPVVVPLILGSLVEIEARAIALEARAFSHKGPRTNLLELHDTRGQLLLRLGSLIAMVLLVTGRILWEFSRRNP